MDGFGWFAAERIVGKDLAATLDSVRMDAATAIGVLLDVCDALDAAHRQGIVHCDVKPSNIIIEHSRERGQKAYLLDFWLAKWPLVIHDPFEGVVGTPLYMAPEQMESRDLVTPATDVWALGILAFHLFTGRDYWGPRKSPITAGLGKAEPPPDGLEDTLDGLEDTLDPAPLSAPPPSVGPPTNVMEILLQVLRAPLVRASERAREVGFTAALPKWFDDWFAKCVSRDAKQRFATAGEAAQALRDHCGLLTWTITFPDVDTFSIDSAVAQLQQLALDPLLRLLRTERGSLVLVLEGTRRGFEKIRSLMKSGAMPLISGAPPLAAEALGEGGPPGHARPGAIDAFISYSPADMSFCDELLIHLSMMRRQGLIHEWHERLVTAGAETDEAIKQWLSRSELFMTLLSADYIASDRCFDTQLQAALEKHEAQTGCLVPILVRACDWAHPPFSHLSTLPRNGTPVGSSGNRDEAWAEVVREIRTIVERLRERRSRSASR